MSVKYYIGSGADVASDTTKWSTTSGGANDSSTPIAGDTPTFDSNSGDCDWDIAAAMLSFVIDIAATMAVTQSAKATCTGTFAAGSGLRD